MFATLLGALPRPPLAPRAAAEDVLREVIRAQEAAGLEPLTDGGFGIGATAADRWRATARLTDRPVKQALLGPWSRSGAGEEIDVEIVRAELLALVDAGCPYVEIHEPAATGIGPGDDAGARFRDAHHQLLDGLAGIHLSLAITGGSAHAAGIDTLLAAPYSSLAVDLIEGPDNWRLVAATPGTLGIVCGAVSARRDADDRPEILLWAADYAASTGGRGAGRVGLGTASSLAHLPWNAAMRKLRVLGDAVRLADLSPVERRLQLDPRAVDIRSAALGRVVAPERGRRHRRP